MKVLIINGSPRANGNTFIAIEEAVKVFNEEGIETEVITVGNKNIRGCMACGYCYSHGKCVLNDEVNSVNEKFEQADGLIVASPVYYGSANGTLVSFLDRLFYSSHFDKSMKIGGAIAVCRRGGASATFDELNKYFTICGMPVVSSQYWNSVHGREKGDANLDEEGLQTVRVLARNASFLIKSINLGKEKFGLPAKEERKYTHFIKK